MLFWETSNLAVRMAKQIHLKIPIYPPLLNKCYNYCSVLLEERQWIGVYRFGFNSQTVNVKAVTSVSHFVPLGLSVFTYQGKGYFEDNM